MNFKICEEVSELGIKVAFLVIYNIDNNHYDDSLKHKIDNFYTQFLQEYSIESLENDVNIIGYRNLHEDVEIKDNSLIASPESLIKILFKHTTLRPINFIVDTYNYIAIKNKVSIGAHDLRQINGNVRLCFNKGDEQFIPLGKKKQQSINRGEYCYIDDENEILCRLDCRQCNKTKTTTDTKDFLFIIQGHNNISTDIIKSTAVEIQEIFKPYTTNEEECILKIM
jgi:DNA/RNA-binding domain of Phe-tRNA-synthetase-like protein